MNAVEGKATIKQADYAFNELSDTAQNQLHKAFIEFSNHAAFYKMSNIVFSMEHIADCASNIVKTMKGQGSSIKWEIEHCLGAIHQHAIKVIASVCDYHTYEQCGIETTWRPLSICSADPRVQEHVFI